MIRRHSVADLTAQEGGSPLSGTSVCIRTDGEVFRANIEDNFELYI